MKRHIFIVALSLTSIIMADNQQNGMMQQMPMDCSNMSPDMQAFAGKLSANNKMMFCGKMNDMQRSTCMQMSNQMDPSGKPMMTPDQAVEKVAKDNYMIGPKGPSGCPVK